MDTNISGYFLVLKGINIQV